MKPVSMVLHVRLPPDTFARIKQLAIEDRRPQSFVARELIEARLFQIFDADAAVQKKARR